MSEVWLVRVPGAAGEKQMTLDELDAAFQAGAVDEHTQIREEGTEEWSRLGELLGSEEESANAAPVPQPVPADIPVVTPMSERPLSVDLDELPPLKTNGKRNALLGLAAGVLALVGAVVAVTKLAPETDKAAAAGNAAAVVSAAPTATIDWAAEDKKLEERQKAAREKAEAERKKAQEARQRRAHDKAAPAERGTGLNGSGDKYDPLNGAL